MHDDMTKQNKIRDARHLIRHLTNLTKHVGMHLTRHLALIPVGDTVQKNPLKFNTQFDTQVRNNKSQNAIRLSDVNHSKSSTNNCSR